VLLMRKGVPFPLGGVSGAYINSRGDAVRFIVETEPSRICSMRPPVILSSWFPCHMTFHSIVTMEVRLVCDQTEGEPSLFGGVAVRSGGLLNVSRCMFDADGYLGDAPLFSERPWRITRPAR
jgi:hypothetical protein